MDDWVWLNGRVIRMSEAAIGIEDRGYQFADGVYEVVRIYDGHCFTLDEHLARLERSCEGIRLYQLPERNFLADHISRLVQMSDFLDGMLYLQVTRGEAPRNHEFPDAVPTVLFYTRRLGAPPVPGATKGLKLLSVEDERWKRCWIKAIALLPNVLAKNQAIEARCDEAVMVDDGRVTECSASNLFIVKAGRVITHPVGPKVLPGITRLVLSRICLELGIPFDERPITLAEAKSADEVFITSTTRELGWVRFWDGQTITDTCGPMTLRLHKEYRRRVCEETGSSQSQQLQVLVA